MKGNKHIQSFNEATENLNISDVSDSKKFSIDDILSNFDEYFNEIGFNYNDDMKTKLKKYINWLSSKLDNVEEYDPYSRKNYKMKGDDE